MSLYQSSRGFFRWVRAKLLRSEVRIAGHCFMCGRCCHDLRIMDHGKWITSRRQHERLVRESPEYARFEIIGRDPAGFLTYACSRVGEDGLCTDYENRPSICSNYPSSILYYRGVDPPAHCGYRYEALTFRTALRWLSGREQSFDKILRQERKRMSRQGKKA